MNRSSYAFSLGLTAFASIRICKRSSLTAGSFREVHENGVNGLRGRATTPVSLGRDIRAPAVAWFDADRLPPMTFARPLRVAWYRVLSDMLAVNLDFRGKRSLELVI